jgi:probable rRNA maturation factor
MARRLDIVCQVAGLRPDRPGLRRLLRLLDAQTEWPVPTGSIAVALVTEVVCSHLHAAHFGDASVTDVMTFPGDAADAHAGDIVICPAVAQRAARRYRRDFSAEVALYLVHGWLHLAGLTDHTPAGARAMRRAERRLLARARAAGALPCLSPPAAD